MSGHKDWCASLTQMLTSNPPKPAPCNCESSAKSQWSGLTDEEMQNVCFKTFSYDPYVIARAIEAALKEKNK